MTLTENAKVIGTEELKELIEEELTNPTIERLMFLEVKGKENKLFPCYVEAWTYDDIRPQDDHKNVIFRVAITQSSGGEFGMVRVNMREQELGVLKRFWDKPPKKSLRDETPWVELKAGVQ